MSDTSTMKALLDQVEWKEVPQEAAIEGDLPYVTHSGLLKVAKFEIPVHRLSDGTRIIDDKDLRALLGLAPPPRSP